MTSIKKHKIAERDLATITPYARNPRKNAQAVNGVAASIKEFGFTQPIVIDDEGTIVCGHTRAEAAHKLGLKKVPVVVASDLTPQQIRALRLLDNRLSEKAEWDDELLGLELGELGDFDFGEFDVEWDLPEGSSGASTEDDEVPEARRDVVTMLGDLWLFGDHRLLCGDSTSAEDVERLMVGALADVVFTDPPYGVNIQGGKNSSSIAGDLTQTAIPFSFDLAVNLATKDDARLYFCGGEGNLYLYQKLFEKHCRQLPRHLIWVKNGFSLKPNGYHNQYEIIFHGYKPGGGALDRWYGGRTEEEASDVWQISRDAASKYEHPTQKPIALPARAIANSAPMRGLVYEPFGGSGSTFIAAERLDRKCYGLEIDPRYVDVICRRFYNETGVIPVRESDGMEFPVDG